jgi:hypothetical protein
MGVDEAGTHSEADIRALIEPMNARVARSSRTLARFFLGVGIGCGLLVAWTELSSPPVDVGEMIAMAILVSVLLGGLPALAVRYLIRRDMRVAPKLVREGERLPARITSHTRNPMGGMHHIIVEWNVDGRELGARFDIDSLENKISGEISIIARPHSRTVGVILNDRLYLGVRNLRSRLKPRRTRHAA